MNKAAVTEVTSHFITTIVDTVLLPLIVDVILYLDGEDATDVSSDCDENVVSLFGFTNGSNSNMDVARTKLQMFRKSNSHHKEDVKPLQWWNEHS